MAFIAVIVVILAVAGALLYKGFSSMKAFHKYADDAMKNGQQREMLLTKIEEQFLWCNSVCAPGYLINLKAKDPQGANLDSIKVDPSDRPAVEKWSALCAAENPDKEGVPAVVYHDEKNQVVAVSVDGALAWKASWWGT